MLKELFYNLGEEWVGWNYKGVEFCNFLINARRVILMPKQRTGIVGKGGHTHHFLDQPSFF